ncbi:MAG TPA: SAF domain-containing protein, partial [Euzebyales bacterium]|nr:SAF domain-containing protein [Euzebyales bacterium]
MLWSLLGMLLIAGCALGFGAVAQHLADRRPVVVLGRPLERGTVIAPGDLAVAHVGADTGVALVSAADSDALVGRPLLTSLPAGALLTSHMVGPAGLGFDDDARTIGLELEPGGYPVSALAEGDVVSVVDTAGSGAILADDAGVAHAAPALEGAAT